MFNQRKLNISKASIWHFGERMTISDNADLIVIHIFYCSTGTLNMDFGKHSAKGQETCGFH